MYFYSSTENSSINLSTKCEHKTTSKQIMFKSKNIFLYLKEIILNRVWFNQGNKNKRE